MKSTAWPNSSYACVDNTQVTEPIFNYSKGEDGRYIISSNKAKIGYVEMDYLFSLNGNGDSMYLRHLTNKCTIYFIFHCI